MPTKRCQGAKHFTMHSAILTFDHRVSWGGVALRRWGAPQGEVIDYVSSQHQITIPLVGKLESEPLSATWQRNIFQRTVNKTCLLPAGYTASFRWQQKVDCISISLDPALIARAGADFRQTENIELRQVEEKEDPLIRQIGLALLAEAENPEPFGEPYAESLGYMLASHLIRHYSVHKNEPQTFTGGLSGSKLQRAYEFINAHLDYDLTLAEIAEAVSLSPYHFARAFKRSTGQTPQQYLTERRIDLAKQLLADSNLPIVDVSLSSGFKNQSHFTTTFRRFTSMTPGAFREAVSSRYSTFALSKLTK